jgi:hypothetical protein
MNSYITRKKVDFMPEINYKIENEIKNRVNSLGEEEKVVSPFL